MSKDSKGLYDVQSVYTTKHEMLVNVGLQLYFRVEWYIKVLFGFLFGLFLNT